MKKITISFALTSLFLLGCASSIDSVDVSGKNQNCVRQCTTTYSSCVGGTYAISAQSACTSGYRACAKSCPDK
jgi:hypothetical protein